LGNKWHGSKAKAQKSGLILADLIARADAKDEFILTGHSLWAGPRRTLGGGRHSFVDNRRTEYHPATKLCENPGNKNNNNNKGLALSSGIGCLYFKS
jgi:hypothetical protein